MIFMKYEIKSVLSQGLVMGNLVNVSSINQDDNFISEEYETKRLIKAIDKTVCEIKTLKEKNPDLEEYLVAEELIASDPVLKENAIKIINEKKSACVALREVMNGYMDSLLEATSEYMRERAQDVSDILNRLISNLHDRETTVDDNSCIVSVDYLYPSFLITHRQSIIGVIAKKGGFTSHAAIMCRSFDIPLVLVDENTKGNYAIIDARKGYVIIDPSDAEIKKYHKELELKNKYDKLAIPHSDYLFLANVSNNLDLDRALKYNFDGIGLYRTEMIFMNTDRPYTFDEQYQIYSEAVNNAKEKFITFRTFDCGDDKQISYLRSDKKGIDNYINNPVIFETQLRAMMKANTYDNMRIMFPMIESCAEFEYLRDWTIKVAKRNNFNLPKIGMMLETKEALVNIESFIKADFISIGTNDLTKELYGIDRDNSIEDIKSHLDDLFYLLTPVVDFCNKYDKCLSVCGELASIPDIAKKFYEIGIKNLSVSPSLIGLLNLSYEEYNKVSK